jgi:hypothetical protein
MGAPVPPFILPCQHKIRSVRRKLIHSGGAAACAAAQQYAPRSIVVAPRPPLLLGSFRGRPHHGAPGAGAIQLPHRAARCHDRVVPCMRLPCSCSLRWPPKMPSLQLLCSCTSFGTVLVHCIASVPASSVLRGYDPACLPCCHAAGCRGAPLPCHGAAAASLPPDQIRASIVGGRSRWHPPYPSSWRDTQAAGYSGRHRRRSRSAQCPMK